MQNVLGSSEKPQERNDRLNVDEHQLANPDAVQRSCEVRSEVDDVHEKLNITTSIIPVNQSESLVVQSSSIGIAAEEAGKRYRHFLLDIRIAYYLMCK